MHAATHGWPEHTLQLLLSHVIKLFREEATRMLAPAMTTALANKQQLAADLLWKALTEAIPETELYLGVLKALVKAGEEERVRWVLRHVPRVLVKLGAEIDLGLTHVCWSFLSKLKGTCPAERLSLLDQWSTGAFKVCQVLA